MSGLPVDFVVVAFRQGGDRWQVVSRRRSWLIAERQAKAWLVAEASAGRSGRFGVLRCPRSMSDAEVMAAIARVPEVRM